MNHVMVELLLTATHVLPYSCTSMHIHTVFSFSPATFGCLNSDPSSHPNGHPDLPSVPLVLGEHFEARADPFMSMQLQTSREINLDFPLLVEDPLCPLVPCG